MLRAGYRVRVDGRDVVPDVRQDPGVEAAHPSEPDDQRPHAALASHHIRVASNRLLAPIFIRTCARVAFTVLEAIPSSFPTIAYVTPVAISSITFASRCVSPYRSAGVIIASLRLYATIGRVVLPQRSHTSIRVVDLQDTHLRVTRPSGHIGF
jgi:hypothetical protein